MLKRLFADLLGRRRRAATDSLAQARSDMPDEARGLFLDAETLRLKGAFDEALPAFRRALLADPRNVDAWVGLGDCYMRAADPVQACVYYRTALSLDPGRADVLNEIGLIALSRGNYSEATEVLDQAVSINPQHAEAWNNFGLVAASHGKIEKARRCFHRAALLRPGFHTALCNLALACRDLGRLDEAAEALSRAIEVEPGKSTPWVILGSVRQDQGRVAEARAALEQAVSVAPRNPAVATAYGALLTKLGEVSAAQRMLAIALEAAPADPEANLAQAHLDLACGRYAEGWNRYEARLNAAQSPRRRFPLPEWDGTSPAGRVIMVYAEQGLGDTIMFASCLPDLMREAAGVFMHCEDRLWPLMQRSFPGLERYEPSARDRVHAYCAIGSLPRRYRRSENAFPLREGYLRADRQAIEEAAALRALGGGIKAGIAWRGGLVSTGRALRSLALAELAPLLEAPDVTWISLQHGDNAGEIDAFAAAGGVRVHRIEGVERDLDAAAAAISTLDVVVTVCSSIAHLAGALGRRTYVLTPHAPAWRYRYEGEAMPWYPSVRLCRQPTPGDWARVMAEIRERLVHDAR
jgi:Tfp pilus assembly protein PilF